MMEYDHSYDAEIKAADKVEFTTPEERKARYRAKKAIGFKPATGLGIEYNGDDAFKKRARRHQAEFRVQTLNINRCLGYGVNLVQEDMKTGKNFYEGFDGLCMCEALKRYPAKGQYLDSNVFGNMLRSEHIPVNLFCPLYNLHPELFTEVMNRFLGGIIREVTDFKIEHAPGNTYSTDEAGNLIVTNSVEKYTDDHTSFDAYFEFIDVNGRKCAAGIEIKYTEKEYGLAAGSHQEEHVKTLFDVVDGKENLYYKRTIESGLYNRETLANFNDRSITDPQKRTLTMDRYRQFWRNHILGESMVAKDVQEFDAFYSLLFYPKGNTHFEETAKEYTDMLVRKDSFVAKQYEEYTAEVDNVIRHFSLPESEKQEFMDWISYLKERYEVPAKKWW